MEGNASNGIDYFLLTDLSHRESLAPLREWDNLKVAFEGSEIWVSNFESYQIHSARVKSLPLKSLFYEQEGKLFPLGSLLPERKTPGLLWSPIERAFPIKIEHFNYNYFGTGQQTKPKVVPSEKEQKADALLLPLEDLWEYVRSAPQIRLQNLTWTNINNTHALILGTPLLPVNAQSLRILNSSIIPTGYDFSPLPLLALTELKIDPEQRHWILWNDDSTFSLLEKEAFATLTIASVRAWHLHSLTDNNE